MAMYVDIVLVFVFPVF